MKGPISAAVVLATSTLVFSAMGQQVSATADGSASAGATQAVAAPAEPVAQPAAPAEPAPAAAAAPAPPANAAAAPVDAPAQGDHDAVVGHLGIGYLGFMSMPYGAAGDPDSNGALAVAAAPIIGVRYWLNPGMGIDAGIGITTTFGSTKVEAGGQAQSVSATAPTGLGVHFGVPLALSSSKHFAFEIIPETNLAYAQQAVPTEANGGLGAIDHSGLHFDLGARAGGEVHFGFIGVPELSLVGSVGLRATMNQTKSATTPTGGATTTVKESRTLIETTVGNNPWDIFTGNVSAIYYL